MRSGEGVVGYEIEEAVCYDLDECGDIFWGLAQRTSYCKELSKRLRMQYGTTYHHGPK